MDKIRVLMIGPGEGSIGGILSLVDMIVPRLRNIVHFFYMPTVGNRPLKYSGTISLRNMVLVINQYNRFIKTLYQFKPHLIHIHTSQGIAWLKDTFFITVGKICGKKIIVHIHACDFDQLYKKGNLIWRWYTRRTLELADRVIAVSTEWQNYLTVVVPSNKIIVFSNCIDVDIFQPSSSIRSDNRAIKALFVGSVGLRKGAFDLIEALGRLKANGVDLNIFIAGYEEHVGDLENAQIRLAELRLENNCSLLGTIIGQTKVQLLQESDIFVLPSYNEGLPMAILEALAAGLPVIATPVGGVPEVVRDGYNGYLVPPGDVAALADKLSILVHDHTLRRTMGQRSREICERELDVRPYVDRLVTLYNKLCS